MASSTDIANRALSMLGEVRITDIADDNKPARAMNARFAYLRDAELMAYPWRFSITRVQLSAGATVPAWGYSTTYARPTGDLRPISIGGTYISAQAIGVMYETTGIPSTSAPYEIIGELIHTNLGEPLDYEYVAQITDTTKFHPLFIEALAARLAADAAEELTQSTTKQERAMMVYERAIRTARKADAMFRPPRMRQTGLWMASRG